MDGKKTGLEFSDMEQASNQMAAFAERSSRIVQAFIDRQNNEDDYQVSDPFMIGQAFMDMAAKLTADPVKLAQAQTQLMQGYMDLWTQTAKRMQGETAEPVVAPAKDDKRFKDATWTEDAVFDTLKQSYLLTSNWMQSTVRDVDGLDLKSAENALRNVKTPLHCMLHVITNFCCFPVSRTSKKKIARTRVLGMNGLT